MEAKDGRVLRVVSTPSQDLALTNCSFCSRAQFEDFQLPRADYGMVSVNGQLVYKILYPFAVHFMVVSDVQRSGVGVGVLRFCSFLFRV